MIEEFVAKEILYKTKRIPPTDKVQNPLAKVHLYIPFLIFIKGKADLFNNFLRKFFFLEIVRAQNAWLSDSFYFSTVGTDGVRGH